MIGIYLAIGVFVAICMVWQAIRDRNTIPEILLLAVVSTLLWPACVILIVIETYSILSIMDVVQKRRRNR